MDLDAQKRALRADIKGRLPRPGSPEHAAASAAAQARLAASVGAAHVIGLYRSLASECATAVVAGALEGSGKIVCYPVTREGRRDLVFRRAEGSFTTGALGIEEPQGPEMALRDIELLVVPALAVDPAGHRLGRGKGYYDATLAAFHGRSIALVFDVQVVAAVPAAPHDRKVSAICSEQRLIEVPA